jgi:phosphatidylglycerol:prolipoprotein diacylglycerol transferase
MSYDATTTKIFDIPPYQFFAVVGVVFASSLFILLLLKYDYSIPRYTKIFLLSGIGLLIGAKIFGFLTGLYSALANKVAITLDTFLNTGIVFYGGLLGFLSTFLLICKKMDKKINYGVVDLAVVCIPLFHFFGRLGCFFGGCCFGIESHSVSSMLYTTHIHDEVTTASRYPVQLVEALFNIIIFIVLISLLFKKRLRGHLLIAYLFTYAIMRIFLEFFRGDFARGVWNGVSFSQVVSVGILIGCMFMIFNKSKEREYGIC